MNDFVGNCYCQILQTYIDALRLVNNKGGDVPPCVIKLDAEGGIVNSARWVEGGSAMKGEKREHKGVETNFVRNC